MQQIKCEACGQEIQAVCPDSKRLDCLSVYPSIKCNGHRCTRCCIRERFEALSRKKTNGS